MTEKLIHGGALDAAMLQYGGSRQEWLDLSTGINPNAYPIGDISSDCWVQLPQSSALEGLRVAAERYYSCPDASISIANGTQALIELLPQIIAKSTIAILSPTYEEHQYNWQKYGHEVVVTDDLEQALEADHLLIVNPNNPDGKMVEPSQLLEILAHFRAKNGYLIIDEAFMDMTPEFSLASEAGCSGLIILRSFGKFFGLAGIRIGFLLADEKLTDLINRRIGLWAISGASIEIATKALGDKVWQQNMRLKLNKDMLKMQQILTENKFHIVGGTDLFCLAKTPHNSYVTNVYFSRFATQNILLREFKYNHQILRFGLPIAADFNSFASKLSDICDDLARNHKERAL